MPDRLRPALLHDYAYQHSIAVLNLNLFRPSTQSMLDRRARGGGYRRSQRAAAGTYPEQGTSRTVSCHD